MAVGLAALGLNAIANAAQFEFVASKSPSRIEALYRDSTDDILALSLPKSAPEPAADPDRYVVDLLRADGRCAATGDSGQFAVVLVAGDYWFIDVRLLSGIDTGEWFD